ncbi:MAG TPA: hypothetical protein VGM12_23725 [Trebonia sp.]|jgi:hypothetical protein
MYLWELLGHDTAEGVIVSGIDDDLAAVMRAGAALLGQQRGFVVRVVEVVTRVSVDLDAIYVPTGRNWLGRRTRSGGVHWEHTCRAVEPGAVYTLGASPDVGAVAS